MRPATTFVLLALCAMHATAGGALDALLAKDPVAQAQKAFSDGDRRHIVIPVCGKDSGEVIPGWPLEDSPRVQSAMTAGQRPLTCADFGADPQNRNFMRVAQYAERYNRKLLELEGNR
jgi:hypothetical protein